MFILAYMISILLGYGLLNYSIIQDLYLDKHNHSLSNLVTQVPYFYGVKLLGFILSS